MIEHMDAAMWMSWNVSRFQRTEQGGLILTDPPHLDTFGGPTLGDALTPAERHRGFVSWWIPAALSFGCPMIHTCGESPDELTNYTDHPAVRASLTSIAVWRHDAGKHFLLFYDHTPPRLHMDWGKPYPLWNNLVERYSCAGEQVIDPFAGAGEIPAAARHLGRAWSGCEIDKGRFDRAHALGL